MARAILLLVMVTGCSTAAPAVSAPPGFLMAPPVPPALPGTSPSGGWTPPPPRRLPTQVAEPAAPPASLPRPTVPPVTTGVANSFTAEVFSSPSLSAPIVGWLQTGSEVQLGARIRAENTHCAQGWYPLADGRGFVCGGRAVSIGQRARRTRAGTAIARRDEIVPYRYAVVFPAGGSPRYSRRPTEEERAAKEAAGAAGIDGGLVQRYLEHGFMVSVRGVAGQRPHAFWSCVRGGYVRYDHAYTLRPRPFHGLALERGAPLPLAFLTAYRPHRYRAVGGTLVEDGPVERLQPFSIAGETVVGGVSVLAAPDGGLYRREDCSVVGLPPMPADLAPGERWVHVSLDQQALVALEGTRPVYATVVSTGQPVAGRRTRPGTFHIQSKHVSATMDRDTNGDSYSIEDVPWTMFYDHSFALHGAFWHERFGHPQSHGCVNLSATDARWLFNWAAPDLPAGWYGMSATPSDPGSRVVVE